MLNPNEKKCSADLLNTLDDFDLQCLCRTVTQKQIAVETRQEAIDAILLCSDSASELLKRTKLKKEHLRDYLLRFKEQADIPMVVKADKSLLVKLTIELWENLYIQNDCIAVPQPNISCNTGNPDAQLISKSFVPWFYNILNSIKTTQNESWGSGHFWNDAKLLWHFERPGETTDEEIFSANEVSKKLLNIVIGLGVYFHPNVDNNGVHGKMNPHGLLLVQCAGTLHKENCVVGLFEQAFGLITDPRSFGNWKIKNTELRMRLTSNPNQVQYQPHLAVSSC